MALSFEELTKLAKQAVRAEHGTAVNFSFNGKQETYTAEQVNEVLREEIRGLIGYENGKPNYYMWKDNQTRIFALISEALDEVIPERVDKVYMQFADVRHVDQGEKAIFRIRVTEASKRRARTFVTRGALAGRYETFMLDGGEMEVKAGAIVSAARIGFEEFLDGRWQLSDFTSIILDEFDYFIAREVSKALVAMVDEIPEVNKAVVNGFDEEIMDELLAIADSYGRATIYCTQSFANKMIPADARFSDRMKDQLWNDGWLGNYKGHTVAILQQGLVDETNKEFVVDPAFAYIIPTGTEKPIKIVFEGQLLLRTVTDNDDWSTDVQMYHKVGVGTVAEMGQLNWICVYQNSALTTATRVKEIEDDEGEEGETTNP